MKAELFYEKKAILGEGPLWDDLHNKLYYVDIIGKKIVALLPDGTLYKEYKLPHMPGCIAFVEGTKNQIVLVVAEKHPYYLNTETSSIVKESSFSLIDDSLRFNDGKCDPEGRLLVGTMHRNYTPQVKRDAGALWSIEKGALRLQLPKQNIPNGLAWNATGDTLYYVDTATNTVANHSYDVLTGNVGKGIQCVKIPSKEGGPDGMCIDQEGMLWIAHWGGYQVARYNPITGEKIDKVDVPQEYVSSCAFGGKNLSTLYITTAQNENKQGGQVYFVETSVKGTLSFPYKK